ncbi:EAL domain-containing protein [Caballeronia sp. LZ033]|uniref:sensor domain-containing phosphodiesterase n=1 Tax=Caballeronia sp. LZ033 TaxID=3038566 RepID=UPI0028610E65|nr:EAL domain-containing protein [Caballeronia sp. LZ033]MDR5813065.1 EAL domain-containing protein [Caballeronia sp. LZ033]
MDSRQPQSELLRLEVLRSLRLLDTPAEGFYDNITDLAANVFSVRSALITFVDADRQWFKSRHGFGRDETPRSVSFCSHAIRESGLTIVLDASKDIRFSSNPLVLGDPGIRFYAAAPLVINGGVAVGTLCLIDDLPRSDFSPKEQSMLWALAQAVIERLGALSSLAYSDEATTLPNLARFNLDVAAFTASSAQVKFTHAVMIDICPLEYVNRMVVALGVETTVHAAILTTERLSAVLPRGITLYRVGYARYAFLVKSGLETACLLAERCVASHASALHLNRSIPVEVISSAGIAALAVPTDPARLLGALITAADAARESSAAVLLYDDEMKRSRERAFLILNSIKSGLRCKNQFYLVFQPRLRLSDNACVSAEALLRWHHPQLGEISPVEFIPIAEQTLLIALVTDWVLEEAIRHLAGWRDTFPGLLISVNIAASDLCRTDFVGNIRTLLSRNGVPASCLELEVTEGAIVQSPEVAAATLESLRKLGVSIAIDDFGSGFSNLTQLHKLPADVLKIDRTLVSSMQDDSRDRLIVHSTMQLAHDLGYKVVAEGVENADLYAMLAASRCDEAQGYFVSRPLRNHVFEEWVRMHTRTLIWPTLGEKR